MLEWVLLVSSVVREGVLLEGVLLTKRMLLIKGSVISVGDKR